MGATITHLAHSGTGSGAGGLINGTDWDAGHVVTGLYSRQPVMILAGGASTLAVAGTNSGSASVSTAGTASGFGGNSVSSQTRYATAATTSATASVTVGVSQYIPPLSASRSPGLSVTAMLDFPDASYGSGSTGARIVFGCSRAVADMLSADNGNTGANTAQGIWFSYSSNRGANWFVVINSQIGTINTVDTGIAFSPGVWSLMFDFSETVGSFDWKLRKIGGSGASGTVLNSVNPFPNNTGTQYVMAAGIMTLSAVARVFGIAREGIDLLEPV